MLEDLPIGARLEVVVGLWMLGVDSVTIVVWMFLYIFRGVFHVRADVNKLTDGLANGFVEINEKGITLLEERTDVVSIVFKEGTFAVGRLQGIPVNVSPLVMVADTQVLDQRLVGTVLYGYGQSLYTVGRGDDAAVAVGLLLVGVVLLNQTTVVAV